MSNIAVIYKSHYGFTKTYASWIAEELSADLMEADKVKAADLQRYHIIIYGGGLYAGGVSGFSLITQNFESFQDKSLYLFTVGAADVSDEENIASIKGSLARVLTPPMLEKIKVYHFRGGLSYSKMGFMHKAMMGMMHKMLLKKPESELRSEDKAMLETYGQDVSFVDKNLIAPMIQDIVQSAR